ncbi:MAG: putative DNA-binding domain-containing protein [Myxococcales bacterium]|nr:putative DNA-binding domain-containing protein [Myxococcales bacterium]
MTSPSLAELQSAITARILENDDPSLLDEWVLVPRGADPSLRFAIHREGYPARISSSLAEAFPAVANILGDGSLAKLTDRFIDSGLPAEQNLNRIGRELPVFLASDPLTRNVPFLPDLAALEWAIFECFHSETGRDFDPATVGTLSLADWARTRIAFRPGTAVVTSAWPIRKLWMTRDLDRSEIDVDLSDRPEQALVYRVGFTVETQPLDLLEAHTLERLLDGVHLGEVMTDLSEWGVEPDRVTSFFASWLSLGLVSACCLA